MEDIQNTETRNAGSESAIFPTRTMQYPSLVKRVQSSFVDSIIAFTLVGVLVATGNNINDASVPLKVAAIFAGASYEPLMLSFSRTIGQRITGLRTENYDNGKKPGLISSYFRFMVKAALGWISFLTIHSNPERRALHDLASGTVVIIKQH